ncbi:NADH-ubiquinone oxidoreductase 75 kDa subunit, mitochondrial [Thelohanellus kitauei]|uniref:NADH-ubiquinone oxidoreductase 75 kDa subunit, mitochondrial n=1 Tax=Thelohanellus kitauei TaxID=669202 RepID=A0A0C2IPC3_THEKT|nr:NADH-ubiquinone oxidoreductase 75 kDa subunit, mitochondrial [Thelohanellus kitauei]
MLLLLYTKETKARWRGKAISGSSIAFRQIKTINTIIPGVYKILTPPAAPVCDMLINIVKPIARLHQSMKVGSGPRSMSNSPQGVEISINDQKLTVKPGITIMQAAKQLGIEIPRFCYHEKLSIAGNCRMCLVEVEKIPKPVAACAMPVMNGWKIYTESAMAKKAREGVMEFLLINHPLDCPICDQGGECDLQDQSMASGCDKSRFTESIYSGKRAVEDKNLGPLVKTIMTRCIHCTRCIRFMGEIAGIEDLGTTGRGNDMQIGTYLEKMLKSELSGNIIDVCPVGALTSKPNQFASRPWEMKKYESIDVSDGLGSNIVVGVRTSDVMRILPSPNDEINEDWISDKARFFYDGLKYQRLTVPLVLNDGQLRPTDWLSALKLASSKFFKANKLRSFAIVGQLNEAESLTALRDLFHLNNCENLHTEDKDHPIISSGIDFRSTYVMNSSIQSIDAADVLVLVGINPRYEATVLNARIRKSFLHNNLKVLVIGEKGDLTYPYHYVGADSDSLTSLFNGTHEMTHYLTQAKNPLILLGTNSADKDFGGDLLEKCLTFSNNLSSKLSDKNWKVFCPIQRGAGYVNALDLGYKPGLPLLSDAEFVYLLGTDGRVLKNHQINPNAFIVFQGHHGEYGAQLANLILPGSAFSEKDGTYVNTEGRAQQSCRCITSPGEAREDWKIIKAISDVMGKPLNYSTIRDLRSRMCEIAPHYGRIGEFQPSCFHDLISSIHNDFKQPHFKFLPNRINKLSDFYMTDTISRHSKTMAQCVEDVINRL